ncbi:hypothetical protein ACG74X_19540 [Marivita sp. S0852]|uniref:hypothetical protein n=1 Tax=Marivita sp. S0852 TaxID=3373893 RepID=UPI0039827145
MSNVPDCLRSTIAHDLFREAALNATNEAAFIECTIHQERRGSAALLIALSVLVLCSLVWAGLRPIDRSFPVTGHVTLIEAGPAFTFALPPTLTNVPPADLALRLDRGAGFFDRTTSAPLPLGTLWRDPSTGQLNARVSLPPSVGQGATDGHVTGAPIRLIDLVTGRRS